MVKWAGRIMMLQGLLHLVSTAVLSRTHIGGWLSGDLWSLPELADALPPAYGAFWLVLGSFGLPLLLLGAIVEKLGRAGVVPPAYVAWGYGVWGLVCTVVLPSSPFITTLIPTIMLLVAARRSQQTTTSTRWNSLSSV
jgi:hypothetical protein